VVSRPLTSEAELVRRARGGDGAAFDQLVRAHQDIAFRTAWLVCGSSADAQDAAQEAFVKAWRALGRFRQGAPFRPWLLAIVANEARNRRRSAGRREALALRAAAAQRRPSDGAASPPEAAVLQAERRDTLLAALERLGDDDRAVLGCRHLLGLGEEETAAALGLRRGTVKSRTSRALERLRAELGDQEP
jgi:RNA polymerase sigma factor (sigma-70 family)